ncbi:MAG: efflux RND transporter periplasmic adaptor subunit [Kiritimatiellae bacterium]|nr:efflux RND transporter periplasmic adaptor subunit [Kiritimatiellia bacterium]MDD4024731.1 efflux RND transporter periplasmic adaptor subunit [Kiritimatiellia bacterium]
MEEQVEKVDVCKEHPAVKTLGWLVTGACLLWVGWMARTLTPQAPAGAAGMPAAMAAMMGGAGAPPLVVTAEVRDEAINPPFSYIGRVEPIQDVAIRAQIDGYVHAVHFAEGALIKAGEPLFTIDPERYEAMVLVRKAEIGQAEAALDRAVRYLKRLESSDKRAITQKDLDTARSDVAQGEAAVKQAQANLRLAEIDLKHTRIIAPITGRIGRTVAHVGDYVAPSMGNLVRIVQVDPIRVAFSATDKDYLAMREKLAGDARPEVLRYRLRLPTGTVLAMTGTRDFDDNIMSLDTATLSVWVRFSNQQELLIPDGYVTVLVDLANPPQGPSVPQQALVTDQAGDLVYVVDADGKAQERRVKTGALTDGWVAIVSGVKAGESVVVEGLQKVIPGQPVQVASGNAEATHK